VPPLPPSSSPPQPEAKAQDTSKNAKNESLIKLRKLARRTSAGQRLIVLLRARNQDNWAKGSVRARWPASASREPAIPSRRSPKPVRVEGIGEAPAVLRARRARRGRSPGRKGPARRRPER
jgi:hypothetical protein